MTVVEDIKARINILDVVSQYVPMHQSGRGYKANCPFHSERTPSFFVFPERQTWRCFGACASGGDVFSFLMNIENLEFADALNKLAVEAGIDISKQMRGSKERELLFEVNEAAREYFTLSLVKTNSALTYLKKRGLTEETISTFELGFSPGNGDSLLTYMKSKGFSIENLALAGVIIQSQNGSYRDLFRQRIMIPIRDERGHLVGFGGRTTSNSGPKYINTPATPLFDKSNSLYGVHLTNLTGADLDIVIVEGYMDTMIAHQFGYRNTIAAMGTSLTQKQVKIVRNMLALKSNVREGNVLLALDPDTAGKEATLRSLESSWKVFQSISTHLSSNSTIYERTSPLFLKIIAMPPGKDPAELILDDPDHWGKLVANPTPLLEYLLDALSARLDLTTPNGKARLAELVFPIIAATSEPFLQDHYFRKLAETLGVNETTLQASLNRSRTSNKLRNSNMRTNTHKLKHSTERGTRADIEVSSFSTVDHDPLEDYCLSLIINDPTLLDTIQPHETSHEMDENNSMPMRSYLQVEYFRKIENREILAYWTRLCQKGDNNNNNPSMDEGLRDHWDRLVSRPSPPSSSQEQLLALRDCLRRLEERYLKDLKREEELRLSGLTPEEYKMQQHTILEVNERLRHIFTG